jgi:hypothetical protein
VRGVALLTRRLVPYGNDSGADIVNIAVTRFFRSLVRRGICRSLLQKDTADGIEAAVAVFDKRQRLGEL